MEKSSVYLKSDVVTLPKAKSGKLMHKTKVYCKLA